MRRKKCERLNKKSIELLFFGVKDTCFRCNIITPKNIVVYCQKKIYFNKTLLTSSSGCDTDRSVYRYDYCVGISNPAKHFHSKCLSASISLDQRSIFFTRRCM